MNNNFFLFFLKIFNHICKVYPIMYFYSLIRKVRLLNIKMIYFGRKIFSVNNSSLFIELL